MPSLSLLLGLAPVLVLAVIVVAEVIDYVLPSWRGRWLLAIAIVVCAVTVAASVFANN